MKMSEDTAQIIAGWVIFVAVGVSLWTVYCSYNFHGLAAAFICFLLLSLALKLGPAPMLAIAASILSFHFHVVGIWLPIATYAIAAVLLAVDVKRQSPQGE